MTVSPVGQFLFRRVCVGLHAAVPRVQAGEGMRAMTLSAAAIDPWRKPVVWVTTTTRLEVSGNGAAGVTGVGADGEESLPLHATAASPIATATARRYSAAASSRGRSCGCSWMPRSWRFTGPVPSRRRSGPTRQRVRNGSYASRRELRPTSGNSRSPPSPHGLTRRADPAGPYERSVPAGSAPGRDGARVTACRSSAVRLGHPLPE